MAKSRNRGGAKAHRKRVQNRNQKIGIQKKQFQKVMTEMYETKMKELQEKFEQMSANTENNEETISEENKIEITSPETENGQSN